MNKHFFELPKAVKRAVWAALMAEWAKKKAANRTTKSDPIPPPRQQPGESRTPTTKAKRRYEP